MKQQTIVAHFTSRDNAEDAREALKEEGVLEDAIRTYPDVAVEGYSNGASAYDAVRDEGGFWASLANLFMPDRGSLFLRRRHEPGRRDLVRHGGTGERRAGHNPA